MASIFVPDRKPVEEILDRGEARALQIRRAAGTDALDKLQRHLEDVNGTHGEHAEHRENVKGDRWPPWNAGSEGAPNERADS